MAKNDMQGTLDLLVLKTLSQMGSLHGYGIVLHIQGASDSLLSVEEGSLYPALHRMEQSGWIGSEWAQTETNRRAKYYKLTSNGGNRMIVLLLEIFAVLALLLVAIGIYG